MAYSYRCHSGAVGPTKVNNRTSWGPTPIVVGEKLHHHHQRPLSANFDRIINSFDRTNAFECVRSAFERAANGCHRVEGTVRVPERPDETPRDKFTGSGDVVVSSYDRADVGLASRQTPCADEEVAEYYRDRLYMSQARQLFPLQEDLADWINKTIGIDHLTGENFLNALDNGVELLQLAGVIRDKAKEAADSGLYHGPVPSVRGRCWQRAARRSFFSRDNMENFITFCRQLGVHENLLFESDDLVLHAQPRNVILCLLELARIATKFKVEPPGLVQLEKEIALEEAGIVEEKEARLSATLGWQFQQEGEPIKDKSDLETSSTVVEEDELLPATLFNTENDDNNSVQTDRTWSRATSEDLEGVPLKPLSELDKRVQIVTRLMQRNCNCSEGKCSKLLKVKKVGEGRYNIAGRNVFIRLLKGRHMMVRVGGGWDTLEHFLTRHDPCQVRVISAHSSSAVQKVTTVDIVTQQPQTLLDAASIENAIRDSIESQCNNNGKITPNDSAVSGLDSDTSSVSNGTARSRKNSDGIASHGSGKSTPTSVKSLSASSKCSLSGRTTPQSSPRYLKSPTSNRPVLATDTKISAKGLKLDFSSPSNNRRIKSSNVINNRMVSPVESSARLLPAATAKSNIPTRSARTPTGDCRKSFPSGGENNPARRRSLNLSFSPSPVKSPPKFSKTQSVKSPNQLKSPTAIPFSSPVISIESNSNSPSKSFLHIRAKYRSPPPRDVPPR